LGRDSERIGKSAVTRATANGPVYDIPAGDLYWDETNQTVHQSAGDTFGLTMTRRDYRYLRLSCHFASRDCDRHGDRDDADRSVERHQPRSAVLPGGWRTPLGSLFSSVA